MKRSTVRDVMTSPVISAHLRTSFKDLVTVMLERSVDAVPVIDSGRRVLGVVTDADLLVKEAHKDDGSGSHPLDRRSRAKARALTARALMTSPAITVGAQMALPETARLLDRNHIRWLPVVDHQNRLIGAVGRHDLLRVYSRSDRLLEEAIRTDVIEHLLLDDPRAVTIIVQDGIATLSGRVETRTLMPIVVRLTGATDGVVHVINRLTYANDDTRAAARCIRRA